MTPHETPPHPLPPSMYFKAGRYYHAKRAPGTQKVVWTALARTFAEALPQYRILMGEAPSQAAETPGFWLTDMAQQLHAQTVRRARECDILCTLTLEEVLDLGQACGWCCAVTGLRFRMDRATNASMRPFMPSIDRIEPSLGYVRSNCRMVAVITNFAMNAWGEGPLREMVIAYARKNRIALEAPALGKKTARKRGRPAIEESRCVAMG